MIGRQFITQCVVDLKNSAVIADWSVVTKDVSLYTIVGGNPANILRKRFDDEIIPLLAESASISTNS